MRKLLQKQHDLRYKVKSQYNESAGHVCRVCCDPISYTHSLKDTSFKQLLFSTSGVHSS